jgi:hypothetical protein
MTFHGPGGDRLLSGRPDRVVNFDAEISNCTFKIRVTGQQLDSPEVFVRRYFNSHAYICLRKLNATDRQMPY